MLMNFGHSNFWCNHITFFCFFKSCKTLLCVVNLCRTHIPFFCVWKMNNLSISFVRYVLKASMLCILFVNQSFPNMISLHAQSDINFAKRVGSMKKKWNFASICTSFINSCRFLPILTSDNLDSYAASIIF